MDRTISKLIWSPYTEGYYKNPYEHLNDCREKNPIHVGSHGSWMFFKHNDVSEILRSNDFEVSNLSEYLANKEPYIFKNTNACPYLSIPTTKWPMYLNGSENKNIRSIIGKSFKYFDLKKAVSNAIKELNIKFKGRQEIDLVDYCGEFVFMVIKDFLDIKDYNSIDSIKKYSNLLAKSQDINVPKQTYHQINDAFIWGKKIFKESKYKETIISISEELGLKYDDDELYSILSIAFMAAFETSKDNLSIALYEILKSPELIEYVLQCDSKSLNIFIEELLRFSAPLQYTVRINKEPMVLNGILIPKKSKLYLCIASANRDPQIFVNPNQIIPDRNPNDHLSFGGGMHFCLGAQIARQELRYCLKPMINFLKDYKIAKGETPIWSKQIFMRTMKSMAVHLR